MSSTSRDSHGAIASGSQQRQHRRFVVRWARNGQDLGDDESRLPIILPELIPEIIKQYYSHDLDKAIERVDLPALVEECINNDRFQVLGNLWRTEEIRVVAQFAESIRTRQDEADPQILFRLQQDMAQHYEDARAMRAQPLQIGTRNARPHYRYLHAAMRCKVRIERYPKVKELRYAAEERIQRAYDEVRRQ